MGGHGAITLSLLNPDLYRSVSAFSPVLNPTKCPWGEKAFGGYLEGGIEEGKKWDATELIDAAKGREVNILVDYVRISSVFPLANESLMAGMDLLG